MKVFTMLDLIICTSLILLEYDDEKSPAYCNIYVHDHNAYNYFKATNLLTNILVASAQTAQIPKLQHFDFSGVEFHHTFLVVD